MQYLQKSMLKGVENSLVGATIDSQSPTMIIKNYRRLNTHSHQRGKNKISPLELFHIQSFLTFFPASCYNLGN